MVGLPEISLLRGRAHANLMFLVLVRLYWRRFFYRDARHSTSTPKLIELVLHLIEILVAAVFKIDEFIACRFDAADQFVELEMDRPRVPILGVLNKEHHEERNNGRSGVDHQLPHIRKMKHRT